MTTAIDVAAEFGGRDAAQAVLPHFRALKSALKGRAFGGFPFAKFGFILRVDGEVRSYGKSGVGNIEVNKDGGYVSVDIGITRADWVGEDPAALSAFVAREISASVSLLRGLGDARLELVDWEDLESSLRGFSEAYKSQLAGS
ncbi:MAG: hypothetical protein K8J09_23700 [Planctomycetes bacterium]|nr:hypothetical protein [Planctomycetota bacterium]